MPKVGIALGGGAPNLTLMSGALLALDEAGVDFDVITTSGAGMVVGLLYAAPRRIDPDETWVEARRRALRATRDMGIDDLIYAHLPVNYRIFQKPGVLAEAHARIAEPFLRSIPRETRRQRLLGDTLGLMSAMAQPTSLSSSSRGLCQPPPWIEDIVDFSELVPNLAEGDRKFRMTAYSLDRHEPVTFNKHEIDAEEFKAALAMPFIYAPYPLARPHGGVEHFIEGSALSTFELDPDNVMSDARIDTIILFDLMGSRRLMGQPRHLIDAWSQAIISPLTSIAQHAMEAALDHQIDALLAWERSCEEKRYRYELERALAELKGDPMPVEPEPDPPPYLPEIVRFPFEDLMDERALWRTALDWSHSNMSNLFDVGWDTAQSLLSDNDFRVIFDLEPLAEHHPVAGWAYSNSRLCFARGFFV
jgi:predicted acylesterase/phospholipase RssA